MNGVSKPRPPLQVAAAIQRRRVTAGILGILVALTVHAASAATCDFPRVVGCRDTTPPDFAQTHPGQRLVEVVLRVSMRFHGKEANQVEELTIDVNAADGLGVYAFSPTTELASELTEDIQRTTTVEKSRNLSGTLGGELPVVAGDVIAHVTPSLTGGLGHRETAVERVAQLSPKHVVVVSGTANQGRGVFFKLKRTTQNTLEGVHELQIVFLVPLDWQSGTLHVSCQAHGRQKLLGLVEQPKVFGAAAAPVYLYLSGSDEARQLAQRRATGGQRHECCRIGTTNLRDLLD